MFALASMLLATGCSQEEEIVSSASEEKVEASFTLDLGEGVASRTVGDGTKATQLYYGVFDQAGNVIPTQHQVKTFEGKTTTVTFKLVKGQTYDFVFWAQSPDNKHYNVDKNNLTTISVNYNQPANAESRDAFLGRLLDYKVESHFTKTVKLTRPFAQLNVGTTQQDYQTASELLSVNGTSKEVNKSNLIISKAYTTLNTLTSEVGGEQTNVQLTLEARPAEYLYVDINKDGKDENTKYEYLSLNYLLAKESSELFDVKVQLNSDEDVINTLEVPSVPLQRNYRTNIVGNLLTTTGEFTVIVDNEFLKPNYIVEPWNGKVKEPTKNTDGVYEIKEPAELAWVAQEVNGGEDFAGETFQLKADLDLNNYQWTPIGNYDKPFNGTLDGNNFTIKHLVVNETDAPAGLFGRLGSGIIKNLNIEEANVKGYSRVGVVVGRFFNGGKIENVNVKNANVEAYHYVGGIAGHVYGSIINCTSTNVTVTAKPEAVSRAVTHQYGDKAGGIAGLLAADTNGKVSGNTVTDVTVIAYRDLGGVVGAGNATNITNNKVVGDLNLIVDKSVTCYDENGQEEVAGNAGAILGSVRAGALDGSNDFSEAKVTEQTIENPAPEGLVQIADNEWIITNVEGLFEFAKSVNEEGETYSGTTVKLTADIALAKAPWTPIGLNADEANKFKGTFDGEGHTITGLYVNTEAGYTAAGFFGALNGTAKNFTIDGATIKHISTGVQTDNGIAVVAGSIYKGGIIEGVTVKNAVVEGNRYVGGISGYAYGDVKNCVVENITLTATPDDKSGSYDNGDKVGGIVGYFSDEANYKISGNRVLNATIKAYRDMGGMVGCANGANSVINNSINVATIIVDQETNSYGAKVANANAIVGRITKGSLDDTNTSTDVTIKEGNLVTVDGNTLTGDADKLIEALVKDKDVLFTDDVKIDPAGMSNAYGTTGINVKNGQTIDGGGHVLDIAGAGGTWDSGICTTGGLIKNITVTGSFRGIFINHNSTYSEKVVLENVIIEGTTYTISCDQGTGKGLEATGCTFNGWTSYAKTLGEAYFKNCSFGEGNGYAFCRPYASSTFENCKFEEGYRFDTDAYGNKPALVFKNCTYGGVKITAENAEELSKGANKLFYNGLNNASFE